MPSKETAKHKLAFEAYYELRNVTEVAKKLGASRQGVDKWKHSFDWDERCLLREQEIAKGVKEKLLPEWIDLKAYMLKVLVEQVKKSQEAEVKPQSTRDVVAAVKEIRSIMGESDKIEVLGAITHEVTADPDVLKTANELAQKLSK